MLECITLSSTKKKTQGLIRQPGQMFVRAVSCLNSWEEKNKKRTTSAVGIMQHHNHGCGRKEIACKAISFVLYYPSIWEWMGAGVPSGLQNQ